MVCRDQGFYTVLGEGDKGTNRCSAVALIAEYGGAYMNPAVTIGLAPAGAFDREQAPAFIIAQFVGTTLVFLVYYEHYEITDDQSVKLATFCR